MDGLFDDVEKDLEDLRVDIVRFSQLADDEVEGDLKGLEPLINSVLSDTQEEAGSLDIFTEEGKNNVKKLYAKNKRLKKLLKGEKVFNGSFR